MLNIVSSVRGSLPDNAQILCDDIVKSAEVLGARCDLLMIDHKLKKNAVIMTFEGLKKKRAFLDHLDQRWHLKHDAEGKTIIIQFSVGSAGALLKKGDEMGTLEDSLAYHRAWAQQRPLSKQQLLTLTAGQWVELRWYDGPNTMALAVQPYQLDDCSVRVVEVGGKNTWCADREHIVAAYPGPQVPIPQLDHDCEYPTLSNEAPIAEMRQWLADSGTTIKSVNALPPVEKLFIVEFTEVGRGTYRIQGLDEEELIRRAYRYLGNHL